MKKKFILYFSLGLFSLASFTSCQDLFDLDSEQVLFAEENLLDAPTDTVYSVIGIISKMQKIADRSILLGEIRGDLVSLTTDASVELQDLANFTATTKNAYNAPEDYYAIINNCNYFLANADTLLKKRNVPIFLKEYAVVKAFRAWTYLQLAQVYGTVPFVIEPILTESQASATYEMKDMKALAAYFIDDLKPYIETPFPNYGSVGGVNTRTMFIPIRLLLGDLCLWSGRYEESAMYYHDYLTNQLSPLPVFTNRIQWSPNTNTFDGYPTNNYSISGSTENLWYIPMETSVFYGLVSDLRNVYNSTTLNKYYYQATYSPALRELSRKQSNCKVYENALYSTRDTLYAPSQNAINNLYVGDLRLAGVYNRATVSSYSEDNFSSSFQSISKFGPTVSNYRKTVIYLRYAEAMNRAGYPTAAFAVLKYGLTEANIRNYVDTTEIQRAGTLLAWDRNDFTASNTIGIHSRGSGEANANKYYILPSLPTKEDTITFVEDLICDEMALETAFEGNRLYDLIRITTRRNEMTGVNNNAYLADKIARRKGSANVDGNLKLLLMESKNWYLPLK